MMRTVLEKTAEWTTKLDPELIEQWHRLNRDIDKVSVRIPRVLTTVGTESGRNTFGFSPTPVTTRWQFVRMW